MIRVVVVDDHEAVRHAIQKLLAADTAIQIVGTAARGEVALGLVEDYEPDILVTDFSMLGMSGIELLHGLRSLSVKTRALMLSSHYEGEFVALSLESGARGYVHKQSIGEHLLPAVHSIYRGDENPYLCPVAAEAVEKGGGAHDGRIL